MAVSMGSVGNSVGVIAIGSSTHYNIHSNCNCNCNGIAVIENFQLHLVYKELSHHHCTHIKERWESTVL